MTTRKDLARDALYTAMSGVLAAYNLPDDTDCTDYIEACTDALDILLSPHGIDTDVDDNGDRW